MLHYEQLIEYTDYSGPKNPKDGSCCRVNLIKDLDDQIDASFVSGTIFYLKYSRAYKTFYFHRENNKPAIISPTGSKYWMLNGSFHRTNGCCIELSEEDMQRLNVPVRKPIWVYHNGHFPFEEEYWMKMLSEADARA